MVAENGGLKVILPFLGGSSIWWCCLTTCDILTYDTNLHGMAFAKNWHICQQAFSMRFSFCGIKGKLVSYGSSSRHWICLVQTRPYLLWDTTTADSDIYCLYALAFKIRLFIRPEAAFGLLHRFLQRKKKRHLLAKMLSSSLAVLFVIIIADFLYPLFLHRFCI